MRLLILDAAVALFVARGVEATSVEAVMRRAGFTVGGFYAYFESKEALVAQALARAFEQTMDRLLGPLEPIADDRVWLRTLIARQLRHAAGAQTAEVSPLASLLPEIARNGAATQSAFAEQTAAVMAAIEPRFPELPTLTRREVAAAVFSCCAGAIAFARAIPARPARERVLDATERMLVATFALDGVEPVEPSPNSPNSRSSV